MIYGLLSGLLWGLDTVLLGIALAMSQFVSTEQAIFLAPFVSTFLHDTFSSIWMAIYMTIKKELSLESPDTCIKVYLDPRDNIYNVYFLPCFIPPLLLLYQAFFLVQ